MWFSFTQEKASQDDSGSSNSDESEESGESGESSENGESGESGESGDSEDGVITKRNEIPQEHNGSYCKTGILNN